MSYINYCKFVDPFYGNGATDHFPIDGISSKWFYIKAICGNTFPHAVLPFGKMSVGAFSGGYPTGYGTHFPNSYGGIKRLGDQHMIRGFSHLHQSGTGAIHFYYNYAITTPFWGDICQIDNYYPIGVETARPGYYSTTLNGIFCELTVDRGVAVHRYTFPQSPGRVAVDFSNDGLSKVFTERFYSFAKDATIKLVDSRTATFSGVLSGIKLYFAARAHSDSVKLFNDSAELSETNCDIADTSKRFGVVFDFADNTAEIRVAYSTVSECKAIEQLDASTDSFDTVADKAYDLWNKVLSAISIDASDEQKQKFYSNLYHSLIKPCDMTGETILGVSGDTVSDIATFWDQYKTSLPLIYMLYSDMGKKLVRGIDNISRTLGRVSCSFGLSDKLPAEMQAKALGVVTLCDAYHMGIDCAKPEMIKECMKRELARDDYREFHESGTFERYTHILDVTDACLDLAAITDDSDFKTELLKLSKNWKNAYSDDGLMSEKSVYYEGDRYNYSFRLQANMEERVALAGGKERFAELLDTFFGFNGESVEQLTYIGAGKDIDAKNYHRFEGFNNESDMEAPFAYIYAGRHDRLCDIIHEAVTHTFTTGRGALPGNNDSGGLTSMYVWLVLGIFPAAGKGEFLIGAPHIDHAVLSLHNGNTLEIRVYNSSCGSNYLVDKVYFDGTEIIDYKIAASRLMQGGVLEFFMK